MEKIFDLYFKYILSVEGGYTNDKHDKGGETNWGITKERARECGYTGSMKNLSQEKAKEIYYDKYYTKTRINEIKDDRIKLSILDFYVNSGRWGTKKAQVTLNELGYNLSVDGIFGRQSLEALNSVNVDDFLRVYHEKQRQFYHNIVKYNPTQKDFLKGWLNRVDKKEKFIKDNLTEV